MSKNEITGDDIKSKNNSDLYRNGWDRIFGKKENKKHETLADYIAEIQKRDQDFIKSKQD